MFEGKWIKSEIVVDIINTAYGWICDNQKYWTEIAKYSRILLRGKSTHVSGKHNAKNWDEIEINNLIFIEYLARILIELLWMVEISREIT